MAIVFAPVLARAIAHGSHDQQADRLLARAALPVDSTEFFIAHFSKAAAMENFRGLPGSDRVSFARQLRGELFLSVEARAFARSALAQDNVFAAARHDGHVVFVPIGREDGFITKGGIDDHGHGFGRVPALVEMLAQFACHRHKLHGEVFLFLLFVFVFQRVFFFLRLRFFSFLL